MKAAGISSLGFVRWQLLAVQMGSEQALGQCINAAGCMLAGKTQRKYTLLGRPGSGIAAVIVEANRFAYVYHETPANQAYGTHQACPMLFDTLRCCSCSSGTDLCVSITSSKECKPKMSPS